MGVIHLPNHLGHKGVLAAHRELAPRALLCKPRPIRAVALLCSPHCACGVEGCPETSSQPFLATLGVKWG